MNWRLGVWVILALLGVALVTAGVWWWKLVSSEARVEIIKGEEDGVVVGSLIWVDVGGAVVVPGVYNLPSTARVKDALAAAGGLAAGADRAWVDRSLNMAAAVSDGYKIYIPEEGKTVELASGEGAAGGCVSLNRASKGELEGLTGIGETRAEAIEDGRPYGRLEELVERKIVPKSVYEKVKADICL